MRELMATLLRLGPALAFVVALGAALIAVAAVFLMRRRGRPDALVFAGIAGTAIVLLALVLRMRYAGAPTIGWPAVWAAAVLPYRLLGLPLDPDVGYGFALALSLLANCVTVVGTFVLGMWTTASRAVGLVAAALMAGSPLLLLVLGKTREVGTWGVDLGLYAYSEPLSTALVVAAMALLVRPGRGTVAAVALGGMLGAAVAVRLSNAVIAVVAVVALVAMRERRAAWRAAAAGLLFAPVVLAYWPLGYERLPEEQFPDDAFALRHAGATWTDSTLWGWRMALALTPLVVLGLWRLPRRWALLLAAWIGGTALFYTFYSFTAGHPRFLLVVLPPVFVLWSAGAHALVESTRRRLR
jgi:hypothetical protein